MGCKIEISFNKFSFFLRTVNTCQVNNKIAGGSKPVKFLLIRINIILKYCSCIPVLKFSNHIFANKTAGPGYKYLSFFQIHPIKN